MNELSYSQIQELLNKTDLSHLPTLRIAVLRNIMIEPIEPYLRYFAYQMGFKAVVQFGEYDNVFQEAVGCREDLLNKETDCVLVFLKLETLSWDLSRNFSGLDPNTKLSEVERIQGTIEAVLQGIRMQTGAMILWHGFELPLYPSYGIWDSQIDSGQIATISKLNEFLRKTLQNMTNAYFVDLRLCVANIGAKSFYDPRYWHIGRAPYTREALREIAFENFKFIRSLKGKNKKCLVLDCDNTLWGGIVGEAGLSGIKLGKEHPGSAFYELQQEIVNLYNRGIIIALCSKNNEADVYEVFEKHPDMVLQEKHIATAQINWNDKVVNLRQIALDLNIGLDSITFMDDSEFETNLIRDALPEVDVIHLPKNRAVEYRDILASYGCFDTLTVSEEDRKRGPMYKVEAGRKKLKANATDMESYLKSLEMMVDICFVNDFAVPRLAQQTQKTNQFNLTTRRYSEANIQEFMKADNADVLFLKLSDKFGDSGIVGTCILRYQNGMSIFDTLLLSCRVLGRGVEQLFLAQALKLAQKRGCKLAVGEYYPTPKNSQVEFFYSQNGFTEIDSTTELARVFHFDLTKPLPTEPMHFKIVNSEIISVRLVQSEA